MSLPTHLHPIAFEVAKHEAGHWIAGRALGFKVGLCTVRMIDDRGANRGGTVTTLREPITSLEEVVNYVAKRVQVCYAGGLGQSISRAGKVDNEAAVKCLREGGGVDDHSKARELIHVIRNIRHPGDLDDAEAQRHLNEIELPLWNAALELVEKHQDLIQGVGSRLAQEIVKVGIGVDATLSADEINAMPPVHSRFNP